MSTQVRPEEAEAILDAVRTPAAGAPPSSAVASRDFGRPLRLSAHALEELRGKLIAALTQSEAELSRDLRGIHELELSELREVSAQGLFDDLVEPFTILRFEVDGQPGWVRWDNAGAVAAVDVALGAPEPASTERQLSSAERRIVERLLGGLLDRVSAALGVQTTDPRMVTKPDEIGDWTDAGARADRARLRVHLDFDGPGEPSSIDLFVPGVGSASEAADGPPEEMPSHLAPVAVELAARLGTCEVPLGELLAIEVGDVIPLDAPEDGSLSVLVEEVACARAHWGTWNGQLAIQITDVVPTEPDS